MSKTRDQIISEINAASSFIPGVIIVHDAVTFKVVYMSQKGLDILQINMSDLESMGVDYFFTYFNEEDVNVYLPKFVDLIQRNIMEEEISFFQQVRSGINEPWEWYLSATRLVHRENNLPSLSLTIAQPVNDLKNIANKLDRLMEEHLFLKQNMKRFSILSIREKEILKLLANGKTNEEIANLLFISTNTAKTHRRNIKAKLEANHTIDLHKYASAFDLV